MPTNNTIIQRNPDYFILEITLGVESGTLDLSDILPPKGQFRRIYTNFATTSSGSTLTLDQDSAIILDIGGSAGSFTSKNDLFESGSFPWGNSDTLELSYNTAEAVTVKIYYSERIS